MLSGALRNSLSSYSAWNQGQQSQEKRCRGVAKDSSAWSTHCLEHTLLPCKAQEGFLLPAWIRSRAFAYSWKTPTWLQVGLNRGQESPGIYAHCGMRRQVLYYSGNSWLTPLSQEGIFLWGRPALVLGRFLPSSAASSMWWKNISGHSWPGCCLLLMPQEDRKSLVPCSTFCPPLQHSAQPLASFGRIWPDACFSWAPHLVGGSFIDFQGGPRGSSHGLLLVLSDTEHSPCQGSSGSLWLCSCLLRCTSKALFMPWFFLALCLPIPSPPSLSLGCIQVLKHPFLKDDVTVTGAPAIKAQTC